MNSPKKKQQTPYEEHPGSNRAAEPHNDEQNQATSEEFEEEGMGVAPKE